MAITDGGMFRREWFRKITEAELPQSEMVSVGACDPSVKDKDNADMKAVGVLSKHVSSGRYFIRYCWLKVATDTEMVDAMYRAHRLYSPLVWWLEAQGAFELLKYPLAEGAKRNGNQQLPVRFFSQSLPKELRIRRLEVPAEQGLIHYIGGHSDQELLIEQFEYYPSSGTHDDGPDMVEMCYRYLEHLTADRGDGGYESLGKRESSGLGKMI